MKVLSIFKSEQDRFEFFVSPRKKRKIRVESSVNKIEFEFFVSPRRKGKIRVEWNLNEIELEFHEFCPWN